MTQTKKIIRPAPRNNEMLAPPDSLSRVFDLGSDGKHARSAGGMLATILAHGGIAAVVFWCGDLSALSAPLEAEEFTIEREPEKPPPPPPPPPAPERTAEPAPPPKAAPRDEPDESEPAPEAAQAGAILTQEAEEDEPDDYDDTFVTSDNDSYAGGMTANLGKSISAVYGLGARPGGTPGGTGSAEPAKPATPDHSRSASYGTNSMWDCGFPWEAERDRITHALARIDVTVKADGTAESVEVIFDPGHGFGRAAKACALRQHYVVALDHDGHPTKGSTGVFAVRFKPE
jgi:protein TonB